MQSSPALSKSKRRRQEIVRDEREREKKSQLRIVFREAREAERDASFLASSRFRREAQLALSAPAPAIVAPRGRCRARAREREKRERGKTIERRNETKCTLLQPFKQPASPWPPCRWLPRSEGPWPQRATRRALTSRGRRRTRWRTVSDCLRREHSFLDDDDALSTSTSTSSFSPKKKKSKSEFQKKKTPQPPTSPSPRHATPSPRSLQREQTSQQQQQHLQAALFSSPRSSREPRRAPRSSAPRRNPLSSCPRSSPFARRSTASSAEGSLAGRSRRSVAHRE